MNRVVVASGNAGKLAEFNRLLGAAGIEFIAQGELGIEDVEEPGLYSARYAGEPGNAARNIDKLLAALDGLPPAQRDAYFHCTLVLLRHADDPRPLIAQGEWHGRILDAPRGAGGFGYDPLFLDPENNLTAAELEPEVKNRISHRGRALAILHQNFRSL